MNVRLSYGLTICLFLVCTVDLTWADDSAQPQGSPPQKSIPATKLVPAKQAEAAQEPSERAALEKQFAEQLSGATLAGSYTTDGQDKAPPAEEKYQISKVAKLPDGDWLFVVRMQFGDVDLQLPLKLQVEWAGDTPVITLTDFSIPGLGTFTSRVVIYRERYAGTWQHGKVGGHLFGRVVKKEEAAGED